MTECLDAVSQNDGQQKSQTQLLAGMLIIAAISQLFYIFWVWSRL